MTLPSAPATPLPWYRQVTREQWKAFAAAYLGWLLDGFDFTILTFLLVDIQRSFTVNNALAGALLTVSLLFRVVGGIGAGTAADRWGRKGPLVFSIVWYSTFAFLSGFATSYTMLFACRALFGIGMGGVWAAGMPLALEHWPPHLRGIASGLLQGGYAMGFILSALVFQFGYPLVRDQGDLGWRILLWLGITPVALAIWIVKYVPESPVWLARQRALAREAPAAGSVAETMSLTRLFRLDLLPTLLHTSALMTALLFLYNAITAWYPTFLSQLGRASLPFLVAFNLGGITGGALWGRLSETGLGRRGAITISTIIGVAAIPWYLFGGGSVVMLLGAFAMGHFGTGNFGVVPGYLNERYPTAVRAAGAGFAYQAGAAAASFGPTLIGGLQDRGMALTTAMAACIAASGALVVLLVWLGPETRGRSLGGGQAT
jgi:SHS family lactate transporter-like MFS transporter